MFASTYVLTASALSPGFASAVARLNVRPPTPTETEACSVVEPGEVELSVIEHSPLAPAVVQLFALKVPVPFTVVKLTTAPAGAFAAPEPSLTFTWAVNVWAEPTSFVAANGVSWMFASTTRRGSHAPEAVAYTASPP